jgi:hypothetical protein
LGRHRDRCTSPGCGLGIGSAIDRARSRTLSSLLRFMSRQGCRWARTRGRRPQGFASRLALSRRTLRDAASHRNHCALHRRPPGHSGPWSQNYAGVGKAFLRHLDNASSRQGRFSNSDSRNRQLSECNSTSAAAIGQSTFARNQPLVPFQLIIPNVGEKSCNMRPHRSNELSPKRKPWSAKVGTMPANTYKHG